MPVIGSCNADGVDIFILDDITEIGNGSALGKRSFFVLFIIIIDVFGPGFPTDSVAVANSFYNHIFLFDDIGNQNGTSLNSVADEGNFDCFLRGSDC